MADPYKTVLVIPKLIKLIACLRAESPWSLLRTTSYYLLQNLPKLAPTAGVLSLCKEILQTMSVRPYTPKFLIAFYFLCSYLICPTTRTAPSVVCPLHEYFYICGDCSGSPNFAELASLVLT